jgi:uncharacterized protein
LCKPTTRRQEFAMVIDCHYHHTPDMISTDELITAMDRNGIEKVALMAPMCGPVPEISDFLLALMRACIKRPLLRWLPKKIITKFTKEGNLELPSGIITVCQEPDNGSVFTLADQYPDRFLAWCLVNPNSPIDPAAEYERWENHPACVGVKAHPFWHRYAPMALSSVAGRLVKAGKPLIMHLGFDGHGDVLALSKAFPKLKIILAHAGFPRYKDTWKAIKGMNNIWLDLSATSYVDEAIMKEVVNYLGVDRCLYGSDGPFGSNGADGQFDHGVIKRRIQTIFPDPDIQKSLLGDNFLACLS